MKNAIEILLHHFWIIGGGISITIPPCTRVGPDKKMAQYDKYKKGRGGETRGCGACKLGPPLDTHLNIILLLYV